MSLIRLRMKQKCLMCKNTKNHLIQTQNWIKIRHFLQTANIIYDSYLCYTHVKYFVITGFAAAVSVLIVIVSVSSPALLFCLHSNYTTDKKNTKHGGFVSMNFVCVYVSGKGAAIATLGTHKRPLESSANRVRNASKCVTVRKLKLLSVVVYYYYKPNVFWAIQCIHYQLLHAKTQKVSHSNYTH